MKRLAFFVLVLMLTACGTGSSRTFIQGTWQAADEGSAAFKQTAVIWQFSRGGFILQQEIREGEWMISQGSYAIVETAGDMMQIELYNISGDLFTYNNLPVVYDIAIDSVQDRIRINDRTFERLD